jgi:hypothetical protein
MMPDDLYLILALACGVAAVHRRGKATVRPCARVVLKAIARPCCNAFIAHNKNTAFKKKKKKKEKERRTSSCYETVLRLQLILGSFARSFVRSYVGFSHRVRWRGCCR